jgi:riboflavin synthase
VQETIIDGYGPGSRVNLEVDLLARYLERLLQGDQAAEPDREDGVTLELLAKSGFLK